MTKLTRQDEIAQRAKRRSTLKSIKEKRISRINQIKKNAEEEIRQINILYAKNPERLRAKYAADEYARTEKARKIAERKIAAEEKIISQYENLRIYTLAEEIFSAIVQGLGAVAAIVATVLLVVQSVKYSPLSLRSAFVTSYACVGASMIITYVMSTLHHALTPAEAKNVFDRLSHAFAFASIGSGYSAILLTAVRGTVGWVVFGIVWGLSVLGIVLYSSLGRRCHTVAIVIFFVLGWSGIFLFSKLSHLLPPASLGMLISSGLVYTISLPFYLLRKIKFFHAIGCVIMLAGSSLLYSALLFQLLK